MTVPHYISENKSDMRGIKCGWYAMDSDGKLVLGPFPSREQCLDRSIDLVNRPTPLALV